MPVRTRLRTIFLARPFGWAAAAAVSGALFAGTPAAGMVLWLALLAAAVGCLAAGLLRRADPILSAGAAFLLAAVAWAGAAAQRAGTMPSGDVGELRGRHARILGVVISEPEPLGQAPDQLWRFLLRCEAAQSAAGSRRVTGRLAVSAEQPPRFGDRLIVDGIPRAPRGRSNPGGFSRAAYWRRRGVFATLSTGERGWHSLGPAGPDDQPGPALRIRRRLLTANQHHLPPRAAFLANSLTVGEHVASAGVDTEAVEKAFRDSGTIHILVLSGTQISLLLLPLLWLCRRWLPLRFAAALLAIPACLAYAAVAGAEASLLRATAAGCLLAIALSKWREPDFMNTLGCGALCVLYLDPLALHNPGVLLSFAAVWGVAKLGPFLYDLLARAAPVLDPETDALPGTRRRAARWPLRRIGWVLTTSAGAYLATAPLLSCYFHADPAVALLANLPALAIAAPLLPLGILHGALAAAGGAPAWLTASVVALADALWYTVAWFARVAGPVVVFPLPAVLVAIVVGLLALAVGRGTKQLRWRPALACLVAALGFLIGGERWPARPAVTQVVFLDVGQGDATVVRLPNGATMLLDAGGRARSEFDVGEKVVMPALRALRVPRLHLIVATHPHEDHIGGLPAVLAERPPDLFLDSGQVSPDVGSSQPRLLALVRKRGIPFCIARPGDPVAFGDTLLEVLGPPSPPLLGTRSDVNNNSVVLRLTVGRWRLLLTGDAEQEVEQRLLATGAALAADVLKLGHHGSDYSSSDGWLRAVRPRVAVASCGEGNRFGHPGRAALARLRAAGADVFRTDRDGAVTLDLGLEGIRAHCELTGTSRSLR